MNSVTGTVKLSGDAFMTLDKTSVLTNDDKWVLMESYTLRIENSGVPVVTWNLTPAEVKRVQKMFFEISSCKLHGDG